MMSLSQRLKQETAVDHQRMHQLMEQADVFANREIYAKFTLSQYYFQRDVEFLFNLEGMQQLIPDLDIRGRAEMAKLDLTDLNIKPESEDIATKNMSLAEALGWIYVSEGSTLGAAFLFKSAQQKLQLDAEFGARNLAAYPEGRAKVWKRFVVALDNTPFDQQQQDLVVQGAKSGFQHFANFLENLQSVN